MSAKFTPKKIFILFLTLLALTSGLHAQNEYEFPLGDFWSLDAGLGMSGILVSGASFQLVIDPKLWLSPPLMVGAKVGINYSSEKQITLTERSNILTFEGQVYMRWNFWRPGKKENPLNIFLQGGLGLISSYRGNLNPFDNVEETRGSIMLDAGLGLTIPLTQRWHLEAMGRTGYPHLFGFSLTAGYKFRLPQKTITEIYESEGRVEYVEVIKMIPPEEIVSRVMITAVEFILFGPDIGKYNVGIDADARQLNELVLDYTAHALMENPNYRVRLEGHANPHTINVSEAEELMILSAMRANVVAEQLKIRGVNEEQIIIISFGGTRTATNEWDVRNRNRRVELIVIQVDTN